MPLRDGNWYCDFCDRSQHEVGKIIVQEQLDRKTAICDECGELVGDVLTEQGEGVETVKKLSRAIEFSSGPDKNSDYDVYTSAVARIMVAYPRVGILIAIMTVIFGAVIAFFSIKYCWFVAIPFLVDWGFGSESSWWRLTLVALGIIYPAMGGFLGGLMGFIIPFGMADAFSQAKIKKYPDAFRPIDKRRVFIVHGHDESSKNEIAKFLHHVNLEPIILHEQLNIGKTIIEKFEKFADSAGYAIVVLTPDDLAHPVNSPDEKTHRARQNVILELGYFASRLGRKRICVLVKGEIDVPSDFLGVVYVPLDKEGAWKYRVGREIKAAGMTINASVLLE